MCPLFRSISLTLAAASLALGAGCGGSSSSSSSGDPGSAGATSFTPPPPPDAGAPPPPVMHGPPGPLASVKTRLDGQDVLDASTDQGGGLWAVTASTVAYFPAGAEQPFTYDQSNGLARGWRTWQDTYYSGTETAPATFPVTFSAVAGAVAGEAIVGNVGAIADRLRVDPQSGAVRGIDNMKVTQAQSNGEELSEHLKRVVATHSIVAALDGPFDGTAWLGGWHGFSAFHGIAGDCGCLAFEEHQHFIPGADFNYCDSSGSNGGCWDGDVWGLALTASGDVWAGDRHFVQLLPQGSLGPRAGLFDAGAVFKVAVDVFPGVRDEVRGLAVDRAGGLWVASDPNGLAWLSPGNYTPTYFDRDHGLPENQLRGVVVDGDGDVWVATSRAGLARLRPSEGLWSYYTTASGLPADGIRGLRVDPFSDGHTLVVATSGGAAIITTR